MLNITENEIRAIGHLLNDSTRPLKERFRALFTLKNIGGSVAIHCIQEGFNDSSALLKHELAYCLGQMQDREAISVLAGVLENVNEDPMVRHEAGEALGAIGAQQVVNILKKYVNDPVVEVAETCQLALERIKWSQNSEGQIKMTENPYASIDPAPPAITKNIDELKQVLLDETKHLFERYRAMFALRNLRTKDAALALASALNCKSALFRHEIAFVLGQLQDDASVPFLMEVLENTSENEMVRHECAEALGSIASDDCYKTLTKYLNDNKRVVKESCEIALDMCEYENSPEFQYANALQIATEK